MASTYMNLQNTYATEQPADQPLQSVRTLTVLSLFVLALVVAFIPVLLLTGWVRHDREQLDGDLQSLQAAIAEARQPGHEEVVLGEEMARISGLIAAVEAYTVPVGINWPQVVQAVSQYEQAAVTLGAMTQSGNHIQLTGQAMTNDGVVRYQQSLLDSGLFADVVIQSMTAVAPAAPADESSAEPGADAATSPAQPRHNVEFTMDLTVEVPTS